MIEYKRLADGTISVEYNKKEIGILPDKETCEIEDLDRLLTTLEDLAFEAGTNEPVERPKAEW